MKISMLKKALTFKLLQALISINEDPTYEGFCTQLRTLDDRLIKLKSIQNSGRRHYIHTPTPKNNHDADAMDWIDSKVYAQARVSTIQTGFQVPGITPEEVADRRQQGISMLKKALTFKLLQALISINEDPTYEGFCTQLRTLDDRLIKLKSIQNSGRRHYIHTPTPKNNHDADAMDWIDSKVYAQARVSTIQTGFQVPGITPEEVADRRQQGVCINCNRSGHIASNCRSTYEPPHLRERSVPPRSKDGSAPVRANHVTLEEDSEDNYENAPMKQGKD
ncbi:hypothetical protein BDDG_12832 [Blastomyces dermatitidis ATCC 18188]|uniref:CCHC-type domain-containing protein n=1 Tax=Ajellomyces dermatitidis (strain ATCC 18188 / CBS 674.68) TaxID=653446 RepID=A0A0J9HH35_AJEDA|nr:hypothetical protein BDDG_12832 [Blastomyces dermatitidis ATCC 18188]